MEQLEKYEAYLVEYVGVPQEIIDVITNIYGYNLETLENILYYYTAYNSFNQLEEEEN